jgi:protein TonB
MNEAIESTVKNSPFMRDNSFGVAFLASLFIHLAVVALTSVVIHNGVLHRQEVLLINLVELARLESPPPDKNVEAPPEIRKPPQPPKREKPPDRQPAAKTPMVELERSAPQPAPAKEEPAKTESAPDLAAHARVEGGGSEAGAGSLFANGDVGVVPGTGTSGGGGGTAVSGLGRGSGAPGLPAQSSPLRTNREAKPIQTVRAAYPPMALRAGLESDVSLRIEVDPQGIVTKAEITKSGGAGFDEEALHAVKQARFEPAQRDGRNVPAEFTFIYRFRLQR